MTETQTQTVAAAPGNVDYLPNHVFAKLMVENGLHYVSSFRAFTDADTSGIAEQLGLTVTHLRFFAQYAKEDLGDNERYEDSLTILSNEDHTLIANLEIDGRDFKIRYALNDLARAAAINTQLCEWLPQYRAPRPPESSTVYINFWTMTSEKPSAVRRELEAPTWAAIQENYPPQVRSSLTELMNLRTPAEDVGKLILWDGEPGGGKSYALRALARSWKRWTDVHYITDPERFFGLSEYMMSVLLTGSSRIEPDPTEEDDPDLDEEVLLFDTGESTVHVATRREVEADLGYRYKLLLIEDAGEYLKADADLRQGQSLSRLLNITDGLLGQGLRFLTVITTNVDIHKLHEALRRPGRCIAQIHFDPFTPRQANEWLAKRGVEARLGSNQKTDLAGLYQLSTGIHQIRTAKADEHEGQYL